MAEILSSQPPWVLLCSSLGILSLLKLSISLLRFLYVFFIRPRKKITGYGEWAVVTGPTDGIGKAMAFELARHGLNLVLLGRNPAKLSQVSAELKAEFPSVDLRTLVIDFAEDFGDGIIELEEIIKDIDVGMLVNNAGLSQIVPRFFHEIEEKTWEIMLRVNLIAPTVVTAAVLPRMLQGGRGAIVNVGSGSTVVIPSFPLYSIYTGTKGYISQLSKSLHNEYKQSGIHVQCQLPLFVVTKITPGLKSSFFIATPLQYARSAIRCIGYESQFIPYLPHFLQYFLSSLCPAECILDTLVFKAVLGIRNNTLAREKRRGQLSS